MTEALHYPNAPITEAIIDIRVRFSDTVDLEVLEEVAGATDADYPLGEKIFEAIGRMELKPGYGGSTSMEQTELGFKRINSQKTQIVQLRRNGFTFSRLAPYDRWEPFRDEARRLWDVYRRNTEQAELVRLAVRYINRFDVPGERVELKDYFRTSPEVSPDLPQEVEQFFMQLRLPQPELSGFALLNQTIIPPTRKGITSIVLDIDLFRDRDVPQEERQVWEFFEELHDAKNRIFEACITETTRELIR